MALASKETTERNINTNGVVIRVYMESETSRSRKLSQNGTNKTEPYPFFTRPRATGTHGYDLRALLLSHSRYLRNAASQKEKVPMPITKTKHKGIWLTQPVRIRSCSSSIQMLPTSSITCGNEPVASKEGKERNKLKKKSSPFVIALDPLLSQTVIVVICKVLSGRLGRLENVGERNSPTASVDRNEEQLPAHNYIYECDVKFEFSGT
ncbi:hypothetical protein VNO77_10373 [Canavalia gladiata]|uniref:Uncharacterized protein n=1 Tax=Canavalia gladiata TaxID=3824 RepID=A0AAN9ME07_CANGL